MKTRHNADCSIYASLSNYGMPEAGICICGYGYQQRRVLNGEELYSQELSEKVFEPEKADALLEKVFGD